MEKKGQVGILAVIAVIVLVLVGGFFLFNGGFNSSSNNGEGIVVVDRIDSQVVEETNDETADEMTTDQTPISTSPETKEFNVVAKQWDFSPSTITVNEGDNVILRIESIDVTHGFVLSGFGVNERLEPGKTTTVEFMADKKGTFSFFCNVSCGIGHSGMRGTLVVQ